MLFAGLAEVLVVAVRAMLESRRLRWRGVSAADEWVEVSAVVVSRS